MVRVFTSPAGWLALLLVAAPAGRSASILFVDAQSGSCTTYNPTNRACAGGMETAYGTIAEASAAAMPGTKVLIRGGTYNEPLNPDRSGTPTNRITFQNYGTEQVYLSGQPAITLTNRNWIVIEGLRVEDSLWLEANQAHSNILRNCVFKRTPANGTTGNVRFIRSHHNLIVGNLFEEGADNLLLIDADYNVVQGNTFKEGRHSLLGIRCGDFNVIRSNYFSNSKQKVMEVYDCGTGTTAVPHSFNSTWHNLIEQNIIADASSYYSTSGGNGIQYSGQEGIIRRNIFHHCNVGLGMQVYADEALSNVNNRIYHNVFYANDAAGIAPWSSNSSNVFKNNILWANQGSLPDGFAVSPGQIVYRGSFGRQARWENNGIFYQAPGQKVIEEEFNVGRTIRQFTTLAPAVLLNTLEADPLFINAQNSDFHLQETSPMIDAGAFLSQTTAAGSGTNLPVLDAFSFYDGYGIAGEQGDVVQLENQTETARILSVNYTNGLLTLDRPLNWSAGQKVSLAFHGLAPDVGAFEQASPKLKARLEADVLILSWPADQVGFRLEATETLTSPDWHNTAEAILAEGEWMVTIALLGEKLLPPGQLNHPSSLI